jgi:hypothetical protein
MPMEISGLGLGHVMGPHSSPSWKLVPLLTQFWHNRCRFIECVYDDGIWYTTLINWLIELRVIIISALLITRTSLKTILQTWATLTCISFSVLPSSYGIIIFYELEKKPKQKPEDIFFFLFGNIYRLTSFTRMLYLKMNYLKI